MSERLFPVRKRCKKCGKKLEALVLRGLFCSYSCGQLPEPLKKVADAPRQCRLERSGKWEWKQKYRSEEEVPARLRQDPATNVYECSHCFFLHVGHSRALGTEKARLVGDSETLGSVLLRVREDRKLTRKDVAEKIKVRPIRIKEIEECADKIETGVLFALLRFYRMKMNILL